MDRDHSVNYNVHSDSVRRIMQELREIDAMGSSLLTALPLEDNLFEWHFTFRGPRGTEFEGGIYHGRILLPAEYPLKPPDVIFLTPNGRFEVNKKICLSISSYHKETWLPSWSIRTALLALIGFMPTPGNGAIGALDVPENERRYLARKSKTWVCNRCGSENANALPPEDESEVIDDPHVDEIIIDSKRTAEENGESPETVNNTNEVNQDPIRDVDEVVPNPLEQFNRQIVPEPEPNEQNEQLLDQELPLDQETRRKIQRIDTLIGIILFALAFLIFRKVNTNIV
eukprot:TRINITY_DN98_c0_g1_i2.p1 TRINITY_DN98_c0_g1~~TRINITY_DN98_c0_g1_i2.p1  ORF type:complete len:285 (+),score=67.91 TRINITY_DN98_c0_g1_i2:198-1052(+)